MAHHRCVEGLDVGPHRRVSPHGSRQHQSHRLAGAGVHPPQVDEKGERPQHLQQRRGKGGRQDHPGRGGHAPALSGNRQPFLEAALLPHRAEQLPETGVPVEDQPLHIGGEALSWYVPQPPDAFPLGQPVIVPVFQVGNVLHKPLGRLAGDGDPPVCQGGHLLGGGQHGFLHDDLPPVPPLPVGQPELLHSRVDVHQPLYRHHRVRAGGDGEQPVLPGDPQVVRLPVPRVQLHGLAGKLGGVVHVDGVRRLPQAVAVALVHLGKPGKPLGLCVLHHSRHGPLVGEWVLVELIDLFVWGRGSQEIFLCVVPFPDRNFSADVLHLLSAQQSSR